MDRFLKIHMLGTVNKHLKIKIAMLNHQNIFKLEDMHQLAEDLLEGSKLESLYIKMNQILMILMQNMQFKTMIHKNNKYKKMRIRRRLLKTS